MRSSSGRLTRTSVQDASAIHPRCSRSRQGTSYFFGPISENTSASRRSSRTSVAVSPSRRLAWISAVIRNTGAGRRWTSEPPVVVGEQGKVGEPAPAAVGHHLVGGQRD